MTLSGKAIDGVREQTTKENEYVDIREAGEVTAGRRFTR
jgi:hypothetical protein